ncbi:hypothetical protein Y1Q_0021419 [Alligator mississippiensis]|uniref:Uncharacterized protein n=1 Tax=Alligator mississippiensis TaxID=8496 RepID=A0A151P9X2_ALLMI|nr:hypothetical protein Y1Q_0021419 [Alligator mississippiensis]
MPPQPSGRVLFMVHWISTLAPGAPLVAVEVSLKIPIFKLIQGEAIHVPFLEISLVDDPGDIHNSISCSQNLGPNASDVASLFHPETYLPQDMISV